MVALDSYNTDLSLYDRRFANISGSSEKQLIYVELFFGKWKDHDSSWDAKDHVSWFFAFLMYEKKTFLEYLSLMATRNRFKIGTEEFNLNSKMSLNKCFNCVSLKYNINDNTPFDLLQNFLLMWPGGVDNLTGNFVYQSQRSGGSLVDINTSFPNLLFILQ